MENHSLKIRSKRMSGLGYAQEDTQAGGQPVGRPPVAERRRQLSAPPPDVIAPVVAAGLGVARSRTQSDLEQRWQISAPPPDVIPPVVITDSAVRASSAAPLEDLPDAPAQPTPEMETALALKDAAYRDEIGPDEDPTRELVPMDVSVLDNQAMYRIIRAVARSDSGAELYSAVGADEEFNTPGHMAYQRIHFGLSFGLLRYTQASGKLGSVLRLMQKRDPDSFNLVFGPASEELLAVTTAATPEERLHPVAGVPLWSVSWVERFRLAGDIPAFQAAQNEEAIEGLFRPMLNIAFGLGIDTERGLAMVLDRVVVMGFGAGLRWVVQTCGPLTSAALRRGALEILGYPNLAVFQQAAGWTPQDGRFGPETHAALVEALRMQGKVPLSTRAQLEDRLVYAAQGLARQRLLRLQSAEELANRAFTRPAANP